MPTYSDPILYPQVARYPAEQLLHGAALELARKGWGLPFRAWDAEALAIEVDGKAVSAMAFRVNSVDRSIVILLGTTHPHHRRRGLYRRLWDRLLELARKRDVLEVIGFRDVRNEASAAMASALGRTDFCIGSRIVLPDTGEGA